MGILGFYPFLLKYALQLSTVELLSDMKLVIDLDSIKYRLFEQSCKSKDEFGHDLFGGNYMHYATYLRRFFKDLIQCQIQPIIVLHDVNLADTLDNKIKEKIEKRLENIKKILEDVGEEECVFVEKYSPFTYDTIIHQTTMNVMSTLNAEWPSPMIKYECIKDRKMIDIAKQYNCPILTDDTDIFLYNIETRGIILTNNFRYSYEIENVVTKKKKKFLRCRVFTHDLLQQNIPNLDLKCIPLLNVMYGYDEKLVQGYYMEIEKRPSTFTVACRSRFDNQSLPYNIHQTLTNLGNTSFEEAKRVLLEGLDETELYLKQQEIKNIELKYIENAPLPEESESRLSKIYRLKYGMKYEKVFNTDIGSVRRKELDVILDKGERDFIDYYMQHIKSKNLYNLIFHKKLHYLPMFEDQNQLSCNMLIRPYSILGSILRPSTKSYNHHDDTFHYDKVLDTDIKSIINNSVQILFKTEVDTHYKTKYIKPHERFEINDTTYDTTIRDVDLFRLPKLDLIDKKCILMKIFRFDEDEFLQMELMFTKIFFPKCQSICVEASFCFILYKYIVIENRLKNVEFNTDLRVKFVDALLLMFLHLNMSRDIGVEERCSELINPEKRNAFRDYIEKVGTLKEFRVNRGLDFVEGAQWSGYYLPIMHLISELITTYSIYCNVHELLENPLHNPRFEEFFDTSILFAMMENIMNASLSVEQYYDNQYLAGLIETRNYILINCGLLYND